MRDTTVYRCQKAFVASALLVKAEHRRCLEIIIIIIKNEAVRFSQTSKKYGAVIFEGFGHSLEQFNHC